MRDHSDSRVVQRKIAQANWTPCAHPAQSIVVLTINSSRDWRFMLVLPGTTPFLLRTAHLLCHDRLDRKSTRLNSSHVRISYAVFCLKKKKKTYEIYLRDAL